ncbi:MAG: hypothetical protein EXR98_20395 [Gemmataceae bacterium]|nr:hypothetical protein [Gemmataceae bacterium]
MKLQLLFACLCLFACVWLTEAVIAPKTKKTPTPKDKSVITPKDKTVITPKDKTVIAPKDKTVITPKDKTVITPKDKTVITLKDKSVLTPSTKIVPIVKGLKSPVFKGPDKTTKQYARVLLSNKKWKTDPGQKTAIDKLLAGQDPLTDQERQKLSDLLFNASDAGLTKDDEAALSYLLLDEAARNASASAPTSSPPGDEKAGPLFLRIYNNTGERLKVWVQVVPDAEIKKEKEPDPNAEVKKDKELDPKKSEPLQYVLESGKSYDLQHNGERLKASAVRVWAISPTRSWAQHRDQELVLTMPENKSKTYTLTFSK